MADKHYVGEYGTQIIADTGVDIQACQSCCIYYKKPSGVTGMWSGTTYAISGVTNYILYTTVVGDILATDKGKWKFQSGVTFQGGFFGRGKTAQEVICPNFDEW